MCSVVLPCGRWRGPIRRLLRRINALASGSYGDLKTYYYMYSDTSSMETCGLLHCLLDSTVCASRLSGYRHLSEDDSHPPRGFSLEPLHRLFVM
jgi:hypothetical protein